MTTEKTVFNKLFKTSKTELATQRVELKNIKTLESLFDKSEGILDDLDKFSKQETLFKKQMKEANSKVDKLEPKVKKAGEIVRELGRKFERAEDEKSTIDKEFDGWLRMLNSSEKNFNGSQKKLNPLRKKAKILFDSIEDNIVKMEATAKELGVKIPVQKYVKISQILKRFF